MLTKSHFVTKSPSAIRNLVNPQYQTPSLVKLIRIDRLVGQYCGNKLKGVGGGLNENSEWLFILARLAMNFS